MSGGVQARMLPGGRLHLQHGPMDLVILAESTEGDASTAYDAAKDRFDTLLQEIVDELPLLRRRAAPGRNPPAGTVARRMVRAVLPHSDSAFITPMAAVAGAVSDEILASMTAAAPLRRAYVNNGGDIALHLEEGEQFKVGLAELDGTCDRSILVDGASTVRGVATSGRGGRSWSLGIADSVTALGSSAAAADAAATLVANAVDLPDHSGIKRQPANELDPESDLGDIPVVVNSQRFQSEDVHKALERGSAEASRMHSEGLLDSAALLLQGTWRIVGSARRLEKMDEMVTCNG